MKTLVNYILESSDNNKLRLNSVIVTYDCKPAEFKIECPETYQEADVIQYMNDKLLNELPSSQNYADEFFGKNADNIYDAYFDYDDFERSTDVDDDVDLDWDSHYAVKNHGDDDTLNTFTITNLKYVIKFDRFDLVDVDKDDIENTIKDIFKATESNDINEYPINIKLEDNISYN